MFLLYISQCFPQSKSKPGYPRNTPLHAQDTKFLKPVARKESRRELINVKSLKRMKTHAWQEQVVDKCGS